MRMDRDSAAASLMVGALLGGADPAHRWLVALDPSDAVSIALGHQGAHVLRWDREARGERGARATPPPGPFEAVAMRAPRVKEGLLLGLELVAAWQEPGGRIWIYGPKDEGIKSVEKRLDPWYEQVETRDTRRHCRLLSAIRTVAPARRELADYGTPVEFALPGGPVTLLAYPGVFAGGALDPATEMLLETLPALLAHKPGRILDFACGIGVIAAAVSQALPQIRVHAMDNDAIAVEAVRAALPRVSVACGDGWAARPLLPAVSGGYDLVLSNPPLHQGHDLDTSIIEALISEAPLHLTRSGRLVLVTQRQRPAGEWMEKVFDEVELLREDNRFRVWSGRRPKTPRTRAR